MSAAGVCVWEGPGMGGGGVKGAYYGRSFGYPDPASTKESVMREGILFLQLVI